MYSWWFSLSYSNLLFLFMPFPILCWTFSDLDYLWNLVFLLLIYHIYKLTLIVDYKNDLRYKFLFSIANSRFVLLRNTICTMGN